MGTLCEVEQFRYVGRAIGSQDISMNLKMPRNVIPDCLILLGIVDQNVGIRPSRDPNCRGRLPFGQPLIEISMHETF
jgi:hypothetical protein